MNNKGLKDKIFKCKYCGKIIEFKGYNRTYKYCDNKCQGSHNSQLTKSRNLKLFNEGKLKIRKWIYDILKERDGNKCSVCGITEWQGKPIRFWVDHIDGDASNNLPSNFRLICLNCDSQTETFGARNMGNGRATKGLPSYGG